MSELPGMWDESDLVGGSTDTEDEVYVTGISRDILSTRAMNELCRHGYYTFNEAAEELCWCNVFDWKNVGPITVYQIEDALYECGFTWKSCDTHKDKNEGKAPRRDAD